MKVFFTSAESFGDGKGSSIVTMAMQNVLNARLSTRSYGGGLAEWFLMFVFVREGGPMPRDTERTLYKRKSGELDLRLHADCSAWRTADTTERTRLLYDVAQRSFDIIRKKKIPDFDVDSFERDVEAIAAELGWTRQP